MTIVRFAYELDGRVWTVEGAPAEQMLRRSPPSFGRPPTLEEIDRGASWVWTEDEYKARVRALSIPDGAENVIELPDDWTPPDRNRRDEWVIRDGTVTV